MTKEGDVVERGQPGRIAQRTGCARVDVVAKLIGAISSPAMGTETPNRIPSDKIAEHARPDIPNHKPFHSVLHAAGNLTTDGTTETRYRSSA
jgi:hypothetical protein